MNNQNHSTAEHWLDYLADATELRLPADTGEKKVDSAYAPVSVEVPVSVADLHAVMEIAGNKELNVLKLFIGALGILLWKYSSQHEVIVAMPPMTLPDTDVTRCATLYCKLQMEGGQAVKDYFSQVHESVNHAYLNGEYDEAAFKTAFSLRRSGNLLPIQGAAFLYHSLHIRGELLDQHQLLFELTETRVDVVSGHEAAGALNGGATIRVSSRNPSIPVSLLRDMAESLLVLVLDFSRKKNDPIGSCNLIPPARLAAWQQQSDINKRDYPKDLTVVDLFLRQVEQSPGKTAVIIGDSSYTYLELNQLSLRISRYINGLPVKSSELVIGVMMDRSYALVGAVLGILRAGAAYIPIDKDYPDSRIEYIFQDASCPLILTNSHDIFMKTGGCTFMHIDDIPVEDSYADNISVAKSLIEDISEVKGKTISAIKGKPSVTLPSSQDLAYIMYSSGTTGAPKGIMMEHGAIMNLLFWYNERYGINEQTRIVQLTNIVIDIAFQEIFSALINGLPLYIPLPEESRDKDLFIGFLNRHRINFIQVIPDVLSEYFSDIPKLDFLEQVLCGGDKLSDSLKDNITGKGYTLFNIYGQTETAIDTVGAICSYGVPMRFNEFVPNYDLLILDEYGNCCPDFVTGEIYTGGAGLARGYLSQPELTAKKFIRHPFKQGQRIYVTGDMARRLPDGSIELSGRIDDQVKILGFRIETGEIENALMACGDIEATVVIALEKDGEKELAAYFVSTESKKPSDLRTWLLNRLPAYMVPKHFVQLDKLPLTPVGKIDRKALPNPEVHGCVEYVAPSNAIELKLVEIWSGVLKLDPLIIGVNNNFFEMGGHSLKAVRILSIIEKEFNVKIQIATIFLKPTIRELGENILMASLSKKATPSVNKITI